MKTSVAWILMLIAATSAADSIRLYDKVTVNEKEPYFMSQFAVIAADAKPGDARKSRLNLSAIEVSRSYLADGRLDKREVEELLGAAGYSQEQILGPDTVTVISRGSHLVTAQTLIAKAAECLEASVNKEVSISHINLNTVTDLAVDSETPDVRCDSNKVQVANGSGVVFVDVVTTRRQQSVPVWFRVKIKAAALLAREDHQSGQVVSMADFSRQEVYVEDIDKLELLEDQQRQWMVRKTIHAGQVLQHGDIGNLPDISKGDVVDALVESNGIRLTVRAKALESGVSGNVIRVMPVGSQDTLYTKVAGKNAVRVE